jgi:hypothetical protein
MNCRIAPTRGIARSLARRLRSDRRQPTTGRGGLYARPRPIVFLGAGRPEPRSRHLASPGRQGTGSAPPGPQLTSEPCLPALLPHVAGPALARRRADRDWLSRRGPRRVGPVARGAGPSERENSWRPIEKNIGAAPAKIEYVQSKNMDSWRQLQTPVEE